MATSSEDKPVLYSYWRSSCSYRVRIALNLKGIQYEYHPVHLVKDGGQQHLEEFATINPSKEIPVLKVGEHALTQSTAIIEYLEEAYPDPPLLPKDPFQRAQIRRICEIISSDIQPVQNLRVLKKAQEVAAPEAKDSMIATWGRHWITLGFQALEKVLSKTAGQYSVGDELTMADCFLPGQVYNAQRFKVDMSEFPTIARVNENLLRHPAIQKASPEKQPDAEA